MCTIIAKKFPNLGWVGIKNRDRPFATRTELLRTEKNSIQRVALLDERTHWSEGMNSNGVSIISSSLTPDYGEKRAKMHDSRNGGKIRDALSMPTVEDAVHFLREAHATGCIFVFDKDVCYLIEGEFGTQQQKIQEIKNDTVVRTNHGILLPHAGYQKNSKSIENRMKRVSSDARLLIGTYVADVAKSPEEMMVLMAKQYTDNPQINTLRHATDDIEVRTTEQLILEPSKKFMLVRNTDGILDFDQQSANPPGSKILVGRVD
jgi:hypothetical protein